jgi:hypothetical protein
LASSSGSSVAGVTVSIVSFGLQQLVLSLQALETVPAPRFERKPGGAFGEVAGRARHEDLARSRLVQDAGRGVHRQAPNLVVAHDHFAAVDADPDREPDRV